MKNNGVRILIAGNHTCGNRGDGAILRGLISAIREINSNVKLDILSRFPRSSSYLLDEDISADKLTEYRNKSNRGLKGKVVNYFKRRYLTRLMLAHFLKTPLSVIPLPKEIRSYIHSLKNYDAVIQVGGSFYVDSYGLAQFDNALCTLLARRKLIILGHSVGPFGTTHFKRVAEVVFNNCEFLGLREKISEEVINKQLNIIKKPYIGADTAWLVPAKKISKTTNLPTDYRPSIAITVRELKPFDKHLNITQEEYECAFAKLCDSLIELGYQISAISTCTGIDGYPKDDRIIALSVKNRCKIKNQEHFSVITEEYNDVELGNILANCILTIGTRLHSAIISMNFGTSAFAINYEHKSKGIMEKMDLKEMAIPITDLINNNFTQQVVTTLSDLGKLNEKVTDSVTKEKIQAMEFVKKALESIK